MPQPMPKRSICCLPSGEMLRLQPVSHWVSRFREMTRRSPTEITLPAVGYSGPLYDSAVSSPPARYSIHNRLPAWIRNARDSLGDQGVVWGSILVEGSFLNNESLYLRNQLDYTLGQVCIANPTTRDIYLDLITEVLGLGVDGIVLDIVDAYPNSGAEGHTGVNAHCFCEYCLDELRLKGCHEPIQSFIGNEGLLRLVLRNDDDGTAHIDPPQTWMDQLNVNSLIATSIARRFVEGDSVLLEKDANRILKYLKARVDVTAEAVRAILKVCRDNNKRSAVILASAACDLTQMTTLQAMDKAKAADEFWLPDAPSRKSSPGTWQAVQFLASRSSYYINAFMETVEDANRRLILMGIDKFLVVLQRNSRSLMGNTLTSAGAYAAEKTEQYSGFVGVPLDQESHLAMIDSLTRETTGQVLPRELLERFRIASPSASTSTGDD